MYKLTQNEFITRANRVHKNLFDYSLVEYQNHSTPIRIICSNGHVFEQKPKSHLNGRGCYLCNPRHPVTQEEFLQRVKRFNHKLDFSKSIYKGSEVPVIVTCKNHGDFRIQPKSLYKGGGCRRCSESSLRHNTQSYVEAAKKKWGNKFDYSLTMLDCSLEESKITRKKIQIICDKGHVFSREPANHLFNGRKCPFCLGRVKTTEKFITQSKQIHGDYYDYSKSEYINKNTKLTVICPEHGEFLVSPGCHVGQGIGCSKCNISHGERGVELFLSKNGINFIAQHRFVDCRFKKPLIFDFFLPAENVCIEFDGYWHFNPHPRRLERFDNIKRRDRIKNIYCRENHIPLIRISGLKNIEPTLTKTLLN